MGKCFYIRSCGSHAETKFVEINRIVTILAYFDSSDRACVRGWTKEDALRKKGLEISFSCRRKAKDSERKHRDQQNLCLQRKVNHESPDSCSLLLSCFGKDMIKNLNTCRKNKFRRFVRTILPQKNKLKIIYDQILASFLFALAKW